MGKKVTGLDAANYYDADGNHMTAFKGEELVNPKDGEVDRLTKLGAFGKYAEEETAAEQAASGSEQGGAAPGEGPEGTDDLDSMKKDELVARAEAAGIEDAKGMKVDELRDALRANSSGE